MKLRRLKIIKFRNVQPETELVFHDGFNVLLGQNGSGKTTLLRLITSVLQGDFRAFERESFALEADLELSAEKVSFSINHERKEDQEKQLDAVPVELRGFIPTNQPWSTIINWRVVTRDGDTWQFRGDDNGSTILVPGLSQPTTHKFKWTDLNYIHFLTITIFSGTFLKAHEDHDRKQTAPLSNLLSAFVEVFDACRFDESLELFSAITGRCSALGKQDYGHITGRMETSSAETLNLNAVFTNLIPPEVEQLDALKNPNFDAPADTLTLSHVNAPFLATVVKMLGYTGAEIKLDFLGKEITENKKTIEYGNLRFFFHGRDSSIVNQDHLSYGQKRLLTFYYYLACNPHVVVADELVNGLHHAWISECIQAMGDRQVFVTSQNPILLDHLAFESAETVRRTFITCQAKPEGVRDRILWSNMSKKNSDAFFRAYKVGIQHVGEILRTKGLW